MKVLLISALPPPAGGIQTITKAMSDFFSDPVHGIELKIVNTAHKIRPATSENWFMRIITGIENSAGTCISVAREIRQEKPEIIHLSTSSSLALFKDWIIAKYARVKKIPLITHMHFGRIPALAGANNWEWKMLLSVIEKSNKVIVLDSDSLNVLVNAGFNNIVKMANPACLSVAENSDDRIWMAKEKGKILFAGHIIKGKGVFELVEACRECDLVDELILAGPVEEQVKRRIMSLARNGKKDNWLRFTGILDRENILDIMRKASVLALPSYSEGFPMVILEGMSMGCAIIATGTGAIPELLAVDSENPCGICVPVNDVITLRKKIHLLLESTERTEKYAKAGYERVRTVYSQDNIFKQISRLWLLSARSNKSS